MALRKLVRRNFDGKLLLSIKISILLKKGWFAHVRVSLKWDKYHIYMAQLSLRNLHIIVSSKIFLGFQWTKTQTKSRTESKRKSWKASSSCRNSSTGQHIFLFVMKQYFSVIAMSRNYIRNCFVCIHFWNFIFCIQIMLVIHLLVFLFGKSYS